MEISKVISQISAEENLTLKMKRFSVKVKTFYIVNIR
jgi:hypothetical protein